MIGNTLYNKFTEADGTFAEFIGKYVNDIKTNGGYVVTLINGETGVTPYEYLGVTPVSLINKRLEGLVRMRDAC